MSLLGRAKTVYNQHGAIELAQASADFIVNKTKNTVQNRVYSLPVIDNWCYLRSVERFEEVVRQEESVDDAFRTVYQYQGYGNYRSIKPMQDTDPFRQLLQQVREIEPQTVVEIGTARGGTFYLMLRYFESADTFVSVNLPQSYGYQHKIPFLKKFDETRDLHFIPGDSHNEAVCKKVAEGINGNVDFLFIDGYHSYSGVKKDFEMYRSLVEQGDKTGVIAFHDIQHEHTRVGVDRFWNEIKTEYNSEEIGVSRKKSTGGIGILYL